MESGAARDDARGSCVPAELLELLVCPACHSSLTERARHLVCGGCGLRYPVRDGIPVMLISEALPSERPEGEAPGGQSPATDEDTAEP